MSKYAPRRPELAPKAFAAARILVDQAPNLHPWVSQLRLVEAIANAILDDRDPNAAVAELVEGERREFALRIEFMRAAAGRRAVERRAVA